MTEYEIVFITSINAESKEELNKQAETIGELFTKALHKKVEAIGYQKKKEIVDYQQRLI